MTTRLAVTVAVDMDATAVTLKPAGTLTRDNVRGLIAVAHRAQRVLSDFSVRVHLDRLHAVVPGALWDLADAGVTTHLPHPENVRRKSWRSPLPQRLGNMAGTLMQDPGNRHSRRPASAP